MKFIFHSDSCGSNRIYKTQKRSIRNSMADWFDEDLLEYKKKKKKTQSRRKALFDYEEYPNY